jgi:hypothetical protein
MTIPPKPGIGPDEATALARAALPRFAPLGNGSIAIKPDFHVVKMIGAKKLWALARIGNHLGFVINPAVWIDTNDIVS